MKLAILFHFNKHTETISVNTNKISSHLKNKILSSIHSKERVTISFDAFNSIKQHELKKGFKKIESIIGLNVQL